MFYKDTEFTEKTKLDKDLIIINLEDLCWEVPSLDPENIDMQQARIKEQIELVKQLTK